MILLGRDWKLGRAPTTHQVEVYQDDDDGLHHWRCQDCSHLGYGNRRERVEAAAQRHALEPTRMA